MRGVSARYDENLNVSTDEDETSSPYEIDLLNPRVRVSNRIPRHVKAPPSTPSLLCPNSLSDRRAPLNTKLPKYRRALSNSQQQVTFAESQNLLGDARIKNFGDCKEISRRRGKGTPRIIRAIRHHSERLNINKHRVERSPGRDIREESSKSSVVLLYHESRKKSSKNCTTSKLPIRVAKSEQTLVTVALPVPIQQKEAPKDPESQKLISEFPGRSETPERNSPIESFRRKKLSRQRRETRKLTKSTLEFQEKRRNVREQCRGFGNTPRSSRLMAYPSSTPREVERETSVGRNPQIAFLMQHMQKQQFQSGQPGGESAKNKFEEESSGSQRVFPFQATASGNLKIVPNQVVFESKKVSVLVDDPRHTTVNVKAEIGRSGLVEESNDILRSVNKRPLQLPPGITASSIEPLGSQTVGTDYVPRTQPYRPPPQSIRPREMEQSHQDAQSTTTHRLPLPSNEVPLSSLGFTGEQPIDWDNIILPEKTDLYQELAKRITNYKNADCIVRLGHDEFHCHLLVLQSYSTYFDEKNYKEVDLTGSSVTSKAFGIIYDWMISSTNESCHLLRRDNILEIFMAAQQLGIKELEEQCWAFIDNDELFTEDTAFLLYLEARKIGNTAVMELMVPRIMKFFLMLVSTKDFLELSVDELCLLLRSNYICVNSEMEVLMSAVRWLMHDWQTRSHHMMQVLKCVRFGLIAPWQLVDVKRNPENPEFMELMSFPEVQKMVDDGLAFVIIKYWYGNQTEDYYHWIDLLGLTEPTNRNWAGEDKNYVTYREFLLYLEEYQRTKMPELKARKSTGAKACHPGSRNSSPNPPLAGRPKINAGETAANSGIHMGPQMNGRSSAKPSRMSAQGCGQPPPGLSMPPEILGRYLSSFDRNAKGINRKGSEALRSVQTTPRDYDDRRQIGGGDEESPRRIPKIKLPSTSKHTGLDRTREYHEADSSKSEEDAATTIQAVYRGYKSRKLHEMKKSSSEDRQKARKIAELMSINNGDNLHKPLEPLRISASLSTQGKHQQRVSGIPRRSPSPRRKRANALINERSSSSKDLEGLRFDVARSEPVPDIFYEGSKIVKTIHRTCIFDNFDEKTSSLTQSDDTEADPFSPRTVEKKSTLNIRNLREAGDNVNTNPRNLPLRISESILDETGCKDYDGKNSLFFPDRESIIVFGGHDRHQPYGHVGNTAKDIYRFKPSENVWEFVGEIPEPRHNHSVVYLKGRIYLVGGTDPRNENVLVVGTVWSYDPTTRVWYEETAMSTPRKDFGLVVSNGKMFAIGGQDRNGLALRTVEAYDPSDRTWREMRPMHTARIGSAASKYRELIWVGGGMTKSKKEPITKEVECYDPLHDRWLRAEPLRFPRCFATMYVVSDSLYVIGGAAKMESHPSSEITASIDSIDVWDPISRSWRQHGEISIARHGHTTGSIGDQLLIIGGLTTVYRASLKNVECYCCKSAKFIKGVADLPYHLAGHDCVALPAANFLTNPL